MNNIDNLGKNIAINDEVIYKSIEQIIEKEKNLINQYKTMNEFKENFAENLNSDFLENLEKHKMYLLYKMQNKKQQIKSLNKILEYLSFLDNKEKNLEMHIIKDKINKIEISLVPFNNLFY